MPLVDPRTDRLVAVWGIRATDDVVDAIYTTSAAERDSWPAAQHLGRLFYLHSGTGQPEPLLAVRFDAISQLNIQGRGEEVFGFSFPSTGPGLTSWMTVKSDPTLQDAFLGYAYDGARTNGAIHSAERVVTFGTNVLRFNEAAGGYLHSWTVSGVEILNRGNIWGRGLQQQLEFSDVSNGRFILNRPSQAGCLFNSGLGALGSVLLSITETTPITGGHLITIETIPLEFDPDGSTGVSGLTTDHGGDQTHPVLWTGIRCRTELLLNFTNITGLHRLSTTWTLPFAVRSGFVDCAAHTGLCLNGTFNQVVVHDSGLGSGTDVTAAVDAVDFRRWSVSTANTFQDEQASPLTASTLTSGFGGVYGRNTGSDLTVFLAGRLHTIDATDLDTSLADVPRGTQATYMTNRTGFTGLDGTQFALVGLDSSLSGRWHDHDQVRRIPSGAVTYTRWISIGTLAAALGQALSIPATY